MELGLGGAKKKKKTGKRIPVGFDFFAVVECMHKGMYRVGYDPED